MKWYIDSYYKSPTKESNTPKKEVNNIYLSEQEESVERSKVMLSQYDYEQVEWSENPHIREPN
jgi:hypothetical protein